MIRVEELLDKYRKLKVRLWMEDGQLRFRAPKGSLNSGHLAELKARKGDIARFLSQAVNPRKIMVPVTRDQAPPLTHAQERLWFLDRLEGPAQTYNMPSSVLLRGRLDPSAFMKSLTVVMARHEVLRTTFREVDGEPVQVIGSQPPEPRFHDLSHLGEGAMAHMTELADKDAATPFDLEKGPLIRAGLYQLSGEEHAFLLNTHHAVSDGWSYGVFMGELQALYGAEVSGEPLVLDPPPVQFADYAWAQSQENLVEKLEFWKTYLKDAAPLLDMPWDFPRPARQTHEGRMVEGGVSARCAQALKDLARKHGASLFMTLLAGFKIQLVRYSGQNDISVGVPVANREQPELKGVMGLFVNTLVLRSVVDQTRTFGDWVGELARETLGAYAAQEVPFDKVVEALQPDRSLNHSPLFQVMFVFQSQTGETTSWPGLETRPLKRGKHAAHFDLTLTAVETTRGVSLSLVYNSNLWEPESGRRFLDHFQTLLGNLIHPQKSIAHCAMTGPEELQKLADFSGNRQPVSSDLLIQMFEARAAAEPDALGVTGPGASLTLGELNQQANGLAILLREQGVGPECSVGVHTKRTPQMVVALLAVLKAGGAYLPLDPTLPDQRLQYIIQDAQPVIILSDNAQVLEPADAPVLRLEDLAYQPTAQNPINPRHGGHAAYMIYTSGSTGRPKGAVITHQGLAGYLAWCREAYPMTAGCGAPVHGSLGFDATVTALWAPLLQGGRIHLVPEDGELEGLLEALQAQPPFSLAKVTPAHLNALRDMAGPEPITIRSLVVGGEALAASDLDWWRERAPEIRIFNEYGPTETVVGCCVQEAGTDPVLPIGRPVSGTRLHVLDGAMKPAPHGVPGELFIAGTGVCRGYHNRPGLTAQVFLPNPFATQPGERIYQSGDRVRYDRQGRLLFLGRLDEQVKLRGFRIEPGEIQAALTALDAVSEAHVLVKDQQLLAYVVGQRREDLAHELKAVLPHYMIPSRFVFLEQLPLTGNGKVDTAALKALAHEDLKPTDAYVAPQTPEQWELASLWEQMLGCGKVGLRHDFFQLGGHSLIAIRIVSRIRSLFGANLTVRDLFEHPTIETLSRHLTESGRGDEGPPLEPQAEDEPRVLSSTQKRLWFIDRLEGPSPAYNMPLALRLCGDLHVPALRRSLEAMVHRHQVLRTVFPDRDGEPVPEVLARETWTLPVTDLSPLAGEMKDRETHRMVGEEAQKPFDLARGPLFRSLLLQRDLDDHVLLLNMHHIISDGWSMGVLMGELTALYEAFCPASPRYTNRSPLAPLQVQFSDVAAWRRARLDQGLMDVQMDWWLKQLKDPPVLELPTDYSRPQVQRYQGDTVPLVMDPILAGQVGNMAKEWGASLFMTLLAVFKVFLAQYARQTDIAVGTPVANRPRPEMEPLVGFFANTLVLRSQIQPRQSFSRFLDQVKDQTLEAYARQDTPFEALVEAINPERSLSRSPLFQVMFTLQNQTDQTLELHGLQHKPLPPREGESSGGVAKFELTLALRENGDGIRGVMEYNTDLFQRSTVECMARGYLNLVRQAMANPEQPVSGLRLLEDDRAVRVMGRGPEPVLPEPAVITRLFQDQAASRPNAVAVSSKDLELTYGQIWEMARKLAGALWRMGSRPGDRIGVSMERDPLAIPALLGILKIGAAYAPIDPNYPEDRQAFMSADSGLKVVIARGACNLPDVRVLDMDAVLAEPEIRPCPEVPVDGGWPAYVIYTSGSTGKPKGTVISHGSVVRLVWEPHYARFGQNTVVPWLSTISFDASTFEFWGPLLNGGRLVAYDRDLTLSPRAFADALRADGVNLMFITTALFNQIISEVPDAFASVETLLTGGEAMNPDSVARMMASGPPQRFCNIYGPTEATTFATFQTLTEADLSQRIPIGRAIAHTQTYVLDPGGRIMPPGGPGQLFLGGPGLSQGYLNRPALTASVFVPDPFSQTPGSRIYATGDLVSMSAEGPIHFLGRVDHQVKIRGFRIEPDEIKTALDLHPGISANLVVVQELDGGRKRLVSYCVGEGLDPGEVREWLRARLPEHMIPAVFMILEALPLNANGKVDRSALPEPVAVTAAESNQPRNPVEDALSQIWAEVLGLDQVGVHQNFFELGGDSILSIQIIARANQRGLGLTPRQLFENQTIAQLAGVASTGKTIQAQQNAVTGLAPLSPVQHWFFDQGFADPHYFNQAVLLKADTLDREALEQALAALVGHHDALRLRYREEDGVFIQEQGPVDEPVSLSLLDLSALEPHEQGAIITRECEVAQSLLDLERGPLFTALGVRMGESCRLMLAAHHLLVDGVTWRILAEDLETAYSQVVVGKPVELPPKTTSYKAWSQRMQTYAPARSELDYWRGLQAAKPLPVDLTGPNTIGRTGVIHVGLSREETAALLRKAPAALNTRINDLLLTALATVILEWTEDRVLALNLESHGREDLFEDVDLSRTVGWFTAIHPVHLEMDPRAPIPQRITAVKEQLRAIPHNGVGYGPLRYLTQDLQPGPQPQISFNYLGQFDGGGSGQGTPIFTGAGESVGAQQSAYQTRSHLIDITGQIAGERLGMSWIYGKDVHLPQTIQTLARAWVGVLREIIVWCSQPEHHAFTPSDFPLAALDVQGLEQLNRHVARVHSSARLEDVYPLSPLQQGMLFHSLSEPDAGHYIVQLSHEVEGLDVRVWREAWAAVLACHPIFRTLFYDLEGPNPLQVVLNQVAAPIQEYDWRDLNPEQQHNQLGKLVMEDRVRGFEMDRAPLMRLHLIRLGERRHRTLWTHHHALTDGWSLPIILNQFQQACERIGRGQAAQLEPGRPFREYIQWLGGQDEEAAARFWLDYLNGFQGPNPLNLDQELRSEREPLPKMKMRRLSRELTQSLEALARREKATLNIVCQAAWALLLCRYSGEGDVVFGATTSGRPPGLDGVEGMVGPFINTLPVRLQPSGRQTPVDLIGQLHGDQASRESFGHTPLVRIKRLLGLGGDRSLFHSLLVFENYPEVKGDQKKGSGGQSGHFSFEQTHYPLNLIIGPGSQMITGLNYDARRFDEAAVDRILMHFQTTLEAFADQPGQPVSHICPLPPDERRLLESWNQTLAPEGGLVHEAVARMAREQPEALALVRDGEVWTYARLNRAANRVAHRLLQEGLEPEARVAALMARSPEMVAALLGVLKAGGTYVPLDPNHPEDRLTWLLEDSRPQRVITTPSLDLKQGPPSLMFEAFGEGMDEEPGVTVEADQIAYIIYTSGSTGRPKGVQMPHGGLANLVAAQRKIMDLKPGDRTLQYFSLAFDAGNGHLFEALTAGASAHFIDHHALSHAGIFREWGLTHVSLPGAVLASLDPEPLPALRVVTAGGERLSAATVERWGVGRRFLNLYGPTEACVIAATAECEGSEEPTIGGPIAGMQAYVLDQHLQPQPVGAPGELLLAGPGLARGYFNRPARTAGSFVPNPFGQPGSRMYRTGDLACWRPSGALAFLGRVDRQVKLRGYRIEPGEIETALNRHPQIRDAVVPAPGETTGGQLAVYYVVRGDQSPEERELRAFLEPSLPEYMIPAVWIALEALPKTCNGKIDVLALPRVDGRAAEVYEAPLPGAETVIAGIFGALLKRERVGRSSSFFAMGGDSILGLQVISRARREGLVLSPKLLFENQTPTKLAQVASLEQVTEAEQGQVRGTMPLTPIQHWFFDRELALAHHWNMDLLLIPGHTPNPRALAQAAEVVVNHHDALRLRFVNGVAEFVEAGQVFQEISVDGGGERTEIIADHANRIQASLDLESGPLIRFVWFSTGEADGGRLLVVGHHLVLDAVSLGILLEDFRTAYEALADEKEPELPPKTTSLQVWSRELALHAGSPAFAEEAARWRAMAEAPQLPGVFDGDRSYGETEVLHMALTCEETRQLLEECPALLGVEINHLLAAALVMAMKGQNGDGRLWIEMEGHGRDAVVGPDVSRTVGWFTAAWPVFLDGSNCNGTGDLLEAVAQQMRAAPHGPGYCLWRWLGEGLALENPPEPEIGLNYLGRFEAAVSGSGSGGFQPVGEDSGRANHPDQQRPHGLDINGWIAGDQLRMSFACNRARTPEVKTLIHGYTEALRALLALGDAKQLPLQADDQAAAVSLVTIRKEGSKPPLFCVHPAGGNVLCYAKLAEALGLDQPIYGLQARGLQGEAEPFRKIEHMAAWYLKAVMTVRPQGPYHLLGWSFGGQVAYEMAQQLRAAGEVVAYLGLVDAGVEALKQQAGSMDDAQLLMGIYGDQAELVHPRVATEKTSLEGVMDQLKQAGLLSGEYRVEDLRPRLAWHRAAEEAALAYVHQPYPGEAVLYRAQEDHLLGHLGPDLGWSSLIPNLRIVSVPGSHETMMGAPHVEVLAEQVRTDCEVEMARL